MLLPALIVTVLGCAVQVKSPDKEALKEEVRAAENAFARMAGTDGVAAAFAHFAADDVVLLRGKHLIRGKAAMQEYFNATTLTDIQLGWEPEFVDVANSGELAYTYGPYTFSALDTAGNPVKDNGYFHTVWKKQSDGSWRFVWD